MRKKKIEVPDHDNSTRKEAMDFLRLESDSLFQSLVDRGVIIERKLNNQCKVYPWQGLVIAKWLIELGAAGLDGEGEPPPPASSRRKDGSEQRREKSPETRGNLGETS